MSTTDTRNAQKWASIAEVAAAQAKLSADKLDGAPGYADQAAQSAQEAAQSAEDALSVVGTVNGLAVSASESATAAALSAAEAGDAAAQAVSQCLRVPVGESISILPPMTERENTFLSFDSSGNSSLISSSDVPILDEDGKIPVSMIPAIAISQAYVVSNQAEMLALDAQIGDVAKRTDLGYSFILSTEPASNLSNWVQLTDDVLAQLALTSGASQIGALNVNSNPSSVQAELNARITALKLSGFDGESLTGGAIYAQIRASNVTGNQIKCLGRSANRDGGEGWFFLDVADTTSADDDGTVLVDSVGRRWKRAYEGSKKAAWWGVKNGADISAALQSAVNTGGRIEVQDGQYTVSSPITVDFTSATFPVLGRKSARYDLTGESQHNTTFNTNNNDCIIYTGNDYVDPAKVGQGIFSGMRWANFCIYGTNNTGRGLVLNSAINVAARNIRVRRNRVGVALKGILVSDFENIAVDYNETGLYMTTGLNSPMNANNFTGVKFGSNYRYAVVGDAGTRVSFTGCDFENNGWDVNDTGGTDLTGNVSLRVVEPLSTINFNDCYFEGNEGFADIAIDNTTKSPLIVNIRNCVFNRGNARGNGSKYVIFCSSSGGGPVILNLSGNFFYTQTAGGYVAKYSEPVIYAQQFLKVNGMDTCVFSQDINMSNGVVSAVQSLAITSTSLGELLMSPPWITCEKASTGVYQITSKYSLGISTDSYAVIPTAGIAGYRAEVVRSSRLIFQIRTRGVSGGLEDCAFSAVIVTGK